MFLEGVLKYNFKTSVIFRIYTACTAVFIAHTSSSNLTYHIVVSFPSASWWRRKKFWYSGCRKQKNMTSEEKRYKPPLSPTHPITEGKRKRWTKLRDKSSLDKWDTKVSFYHHAFQWLKVHFWWTEINQGNNGDHFAFSRDKRVNSKLCGHKAGQCWRHALK
jgi:hypothetical protein